LKEKGKALVLDLLCETNILIVRLVDVPMDMNKKTLEVPRVSSLPMKYLSFPLGLLEKMEWYY
jgi:hypothetical protein